MQQNRNNEEPPKVMTWGKAAPILAVAGLFDLLRLFFSLFWFLGPALAALYCTVNASETLANWTFGLLGVKTAAVACSAGAAAIGAAGVAVTAPFGIVMAMATGFAGFLVLGLWIIMANARIFKASATGAFQLVASFGMSEIPFIGALPVFTIALWKLYKNQIQVEQAAYKKWEKEQEEAGAQTRRQQAVQAMQRQQAQVAEQNQFMEQQAANDEEFAQEQEAVQTKELGRVEEEAANDDQYTQKKFA